MKHRRGHSGQNRIRHAIRGVRDKKLSIAERLAGSIKLDERHNPVDEARLWQSQNPGKGDYSRERSHVCDLGIDEIFQGIERMKKDKTVGRQDDR